MVKKADKVVDRWLRANIKSGDVTGILKAIENGVDIECYLDDDSPTALSLAARRGNINVLKLLVAKGARRQRSTQKYPPERQF